MSRSARLVALGSAILLMSVLTPSTGGATSPLSRTAANQRAGSGKVVDEGTTPHITTTPGPCVDAKTGIDLFTDENGS
jgi:hypothetical protein